MGQLEAALFGRFPAAAAAVAVDARAEQAVGAEGQGVLRLVVRRQHRAVTELRAGGQDRQQREQCTATLQAGDQP
jgi:hypothetical protein